ncbi:MAG: uracil-DNA glycosylase [Oscillospiraceae bacterium]|nr:uracil-DNA glycosylase [Oscillospiraceae bacterium]
MLDWDALEKTCHSCQNCALGETRTNVVFGTGDRNAKVMFIGEGPGEQEDLRGEPFVGRAGQLLDEMLAAIGLSRRQVYIANIVKCRPPNNRDPLNIEQDACIGYLRNQVYLIKPKIIVCLGRIAAMKIIRADYKITQEHGLFEKRGETLLTATFHPAFVLRDPRKRPDAFMDMCAIEDQLE